MAVCTQTHDKTSLQMQPNVLTRVPLLSMQALPYLVAGIGNSKHICAKLRVTHLLQGAGGKATGTSVGMGENASAKQGLTSVSTTSNDTMAGNAIHSSAASGSSAAQLSSYTQTSTNSNKPSHSTSANNALADTQLLNSVADGTYVTSKSTQDEVRGSWLNCLR